MVIRVLPPPSTLLRDSVRRARSRLGTLLALASWPLVPLLFFGPLIAEVSVALEADLAIAPEEIVTPAAEVLALLGTVVSIVVAMAAGNGMFIALREPIDPGPREAVRRGLRRVGALLWTQLLAGGALLLVAAPSLTFIWVMSRTLGPSDSPAQSFSVVTTVIAVLLFLPVFLVAAWYAFAPIPAALGDAWGRDALHISHRLVTGTTPRVVGLLILWVFLELVLSVSLRALFPGLALFQTLAFYFTTTVVGTAYLYAVYEALHHA